MCRWFRGHLDGEGLEPERKFVNLIQNLYLQSWKCQNSYFRPGNSQIKTCLLSKLFSWKMRQYAIFVPINLSLHMSKQAPSLQMCIWGKTKNPKSAFGVFILKVLKQLAPSPWAGVWESVFYPSYFVSLIFLSAHCTPLSDSFSFIPSLDTLIVTVYITGSEFVQLESCISTPEASSAPPSLDCSSSEEKKHR